MTIPTSPEGFVRQTPFSDPGEYATLFDAIPPGINGISAVVRNLLVHYRADGFTFEGDRLDEINSRWTDRIIAVDQSRHPFPLATPREQEQRVAGCCRDYTLLAVAALRHQGVPARSRIGFAPYFTPGWNHDHVVAEFWDGTRWVFADAEMDPAGDWPFDPADMPRNFGPGMTGTSFPTAAQVWHAYRHDGLDLSTYGVAPELPLTGEWFVARYVILEVAHRYGDEVLLWDGWGVMPMPDEPVAYDVIDEVAALLLAADGGDEPAEAKLAAWYASDPRINPMGSLTSHSPAGKVTEVNLKTRTAEPFADHELMVILDGVSRG